MLAAMLLFAMSQSFSAEEPAYALSGTIDSLMKLTEGSTEWDPLTETTGKISIKLSQPAGGAEFTAYKLLKIENVDGMLQVSMEPSAQDFWNQYVDDNAVTRSGDATIANIKEAINKHVEKAEKSSSVVEAFVKFAPKPTGTGTGPVIGASAEITTGFGFYVIQQTTAPDGGYIASAPVLACLPMQGPEGDPNAGKWLSSYTVVPKDDKVRITKQVKASDELPYSDETITEIGDTVSYEIIAKLPEYGYDIINSGITYQLVDTLPPALDYKADPAVTVTFRKKGEVDFAPVAGYTASYDNGTRELTFSISDYAAAINGRYEEVKITYSADLNGQATIEDAGNLNEAVLTYTAAKDEPAKTIKASAKVYTLGLDITKIEKGTTNALIGAEFEVHKNADGSDPAMQFIDITASDPDGIQRYRVATSTEIADGSVAKVTTIKVTETNDANKGKLKIDGLNNATYYFKETKAPTGYNLPKDLFPVEVKPSDYVDAVKGDYTDETKTVLRFDSNRQSKDIENSTGINLPVTGGMGTILFTAIGLLLMAGAAYLLFGKKKRCN